MIQSVAAAVQNKVHTKIAAVVSKCIAAVFKDPYTFEIRFEKKRGRTEARPVFVRDGHELDPLDGTGGGVLDVAALALRVICLSMSRPAVRKLLVLDEPMKNLNGSGNRQRAAELIESLADEYGIQIVMTTGYEWLRIGRVVEL